MPTVGDEIVVRARVSEFFSMTQLSGASQVTKLASDVPAGEVQIDDATPPSELAAAERFWERHEGMQLRSARAPARSRAATSSAARPTPRSG